MFISLYATMIKEELFDIINVQLKLNKIFTFTGTKETYFFAFEFKKI